MDQGMAQREWGEDGLPIGEADAERAAREVREAAIIAQGIAEFKAGYYLLDDEVDAWFEELERNPDAPVPQPPRRAPLL